MTMPTMRITTSFSSEKNSHMMRDRSPIVPIMMPNAMQKINTPVQVRHTHTHSLTPAYTCVSRAILSIRPYTNVYRP